MTISLFRRQQWYEANQLSWLGPEPGDRVKFRRKNGVYTHWGIVETVDADGTVSVIHFTPTEGARKAAICRSSLECAANGGLCAIDNTADEVWGRLPTEEILYRARSQIGETRYHLLLHNCEVFATWCRNDVFYSEQVKPDRLCHGAFYSLTDIVEQRRARAARLLLGRMPAQWARFEANYKLVNRLHVYTQDFMCSGCNRTFARSENLRSAVGLHYFLSYLYELSSTFVLLLRIHRRARAGLLVAPYARYREAAAATGGADQ